MYPFGCGMFPFHHPSAARAAARRGKLALIGRFETGQTTVSACHASRRGGALLGLTYRARRRSAAQRGSSVLAAESAVRLSPLWLCESHWPDSAHAAGYSAGYRRRISARGSAYYCRRLRLYFYVRGVSPRARYVERRLPAVSTSRSAAPTATRRRAQLTLGASDAGSEQ